MSWKLMLAMGCTFVSGAVIGSVATVRVVQKHVAARMDHQQWGPRTMAWLTKELTLTAQQQQELRPVVDSMVDRLKQLRDDAESGRKGIIYQLLVEIDSTLTPEQRDTLKRLIQERQAQKANTTHKMEN